MSTTKDLQDIFSETLRELRTKRLITADERGEAKLAFDNKISRHQVETVTDAKREADALRERVKGRLPPANLPVKGRKERSATFPTEQAAIGFATNFKKDAGAYGMKRDGKRCTFKVHPDDHRASVLENAAQAWGGSIK